MKLEYKTIRSDPESAARSVKYFRAEDDAEAIAAASEDACDLEDGWSLELWQRNRLVARFPHR